MSIDLTKLDAEHWHRTAYLFGETVPRVSRESAQWIDSSYAHRERLSALWRFLSVHLTDGVPGRIDTLERVWYFPWTECELEMELAFAYALAGLHRASIDHARRCLELVVVGAYFIADHIDENAGARWLQSRDETPLFSRAIKGLAEEGFAQTVFEGTSWRKDVQDHYWRLSDFVHVRGQKFSIRELQSSNAIIAGFPMIGFTPARLQSTLDLLIATGEHILVALVLANPVLLFGIPIEAKYGVHGPIGFFEDGLAAELQSLLPEAHRASLIQLAESDEGVASLRAFFEGMPDLSEDEIQAQINDL